MTDILIQILNTLVDWYADYFYSDPILLLLFATPIIILGSFLLAIIVSSLLEEMNRIYEGTIVKKVHEPERRWVSFIHVNTGKVTTLVPMFHFDDEDWVIVIQATDKNGKTRTSRWYVSQTTWDSLNVGDYFQASEADSYRDDIDKRKATSEEVEEHSTDT